MERVRRRWPRMLHPALMNAPMIYSADGREVLTSIYREYLDAGQSAGLPMLLLTPTWRATLPRTEGGPFAGRDLNGDAARFMSVVRRNAACR